MATQQKVDIVSEFTDKFKRAKSLFLTDHTGIDVRTATGIRSKFREQKIEYKILKNRLAKRSLNNAEITELDEHLNGVTSFVISYDDPVAPARILKEFNKKKEILRLKVVYLDGQIIQGERASSLADLPSREDLLSMLVGVLQAPMARFLGTLQAPMQKIIRTLDAVKESK
jgi:large subunit ribosomal protein L10